MNANILGKLAAVRSSLGKLKGSKDLGEAKAPGRSEPSLWSWGLPVAAGLMAGWFGATCAEVLLDGANGRARPLAAEASLVSAAPVDNSDSMAAFLRTNPFKVTPLPEIIPAEPAAESSPSGSLAAAILKGTSPGHIAWMEDQGRLVLVLLGGSFDVYTLEEVTYLDATFVKDGERVVKEIAYGSPSTPAEPELPVQAAAAEDPAVTGEVVPSAPGSGAKGVIPAELINHLLENPFDELRNVRIRPAADGQQGLEVQWINDQSILSRFGIQQGDVVHSVNGIVFKNTADIMNSMASLMASEQFSVEMTRGGAKTSLEYEVR